MMGTIWVQFSGLLFLPGNDRRDGGRARVVQQTLLGSHAGYPVKVPLPVKGWWNVVNTTDSLAFAAAPAFASGTPSKRPHDMILDLGGPDGHSATRYLGSAAGGQVIADAWCAASPKDAGCAAH